MTAAGAVGAAGWAFLLFAGVGLPLAAVGFARGEAGRERDPSRASLYASALLTHAMLLAAALLASRAEGLTLGGGSGADPRHLAAAAATLLAAVAVGELSWRSRTSAERERLWVRRVVPQTPAERRLWLVVSAGAAIAEEAAYRGAFVAFAAAATGSVPVAVVASAVAFAAVHAPQGLASVGYVLVLALLHHALVLYTGTLLLAVAVHFSYDVLAGLWLAKRHGLTAAAAHVPRS